MRNPDNLWRLLILDLDERDNIAENSKKTRATLPGSLQTGVISGMLKFLAS